ncbi:hypothetical protein [Humibacter sp. RRB41]|uniref:hypothetical protein n=1 Tax=Humibacter sp. RRB41 TaxID=2919946 RepID=UPI001FA9A4A6|nr:hypothetical protein [Humibacter sp. RRB41]
MTTDRRDEAPDQNEPLQHSQKDSKVEGAVEWLDERLRGTRDHHASPAATDITERRTL